MNNLNFMKCVFFTHQQFNVDKIYLSSQSLTINRIINAPNPQIISNTVDNIIDYVYQELNRNNFSGIPWKIPMPIFILMGRKLDYDKNILENETFKTDYKVPFSYGSETLVPKVVNKQGTLAIIDFMKSYFKSGLGDTEKDKRKYDASLINSYKFKGNIQLFVFFPYLTSDFKYLTNFKDIGNSSSFFYTLISTKTFLSFQRTTTLNEADLRKIMKKPYYSDETIALTLDIFRTYERSKYGFYDDLYKLCYDGGCISEEGEDFGRLLPDYIKDDEGKNNDNAMKYSPFLPNKCLAQTTGYINNIKNAKDSNLELHNLLKEHSMKDIKESLEKYLKELENISKSGKTNLKYDDVTNFKSPVDLIINIINETIKNKFIRNMNDASPNHYSKEYSQNIIKELALLRKSYPGIPEVIMSLYLYKENFKSNKIAYMPWGRKIISNRNVLNVNDLLQVNKRLYSFNNRYFLTITNTGIIFVADKYSGNILYFINRKPIKRTNGLTFETGGFFIEFVDNNGNIKTNNISNSNGITSLIGDCDECNNGPHSLIIEDNGNIAIYANSFFNANSNKLKNLINNERIFIDNFNFKNFNFGISGQYNEEEITRKTFNINDPKFAEMTSYEISDIKEEEEYLYCADIDKECRK